MTRERKSPQQKKRLEYDKDHFTFAEHLHAFRKQWPRKKTLTSRKYRRNSDELLAPAKPEVSSEDVDLAVGDVTTGQIAKSLVGKRLRKSGTVTVGEKVNLKLQKRAARVGRRVKSQQKYDLLAEEAVDTLSSLDGGPLVDFVRRAAVFLHGGDSVEWARVKQSKHRLDRALSFLESHQRGSAGEREAICRNIQLRKRFEDWARKTNRILGKDRRSMQKKIQQKISTKKKIKATRRQAEANSTGK